MSVHTTTYIHMHAEDDITVAVGTVDLTGTIVRLGDGADVALFFDRASALELALGILARYEPMPAAPCPDPWHFDFDDASLATLIQCSTCQED